MSSWRIDSLPGDGQRVPTGAWRRFRLELGDCALAHEPVVIVDVLCGAERRRGTTDELGQISFLQRHDPVHGFQAPRAFAVEVRGEVVEAH